MGAKNTSKKIENKEETRGFWARHKKLRAWLIGIGVTVVLTGLLVVVAFRVSPWPSALLLRYEMDKASAKMSQALEKHVPTGITSVDNQQYQTNSSDGYLDVFYPSNTTTPLPTVIWVHGGAWVSGDKNNVDNYLKILASYGFTTVGVDYTIAPEALYPTPLKQVEQALAYLQNNAKQLNIDTTNIVLAGDSAGSQIIAQTANLITSPAYADEVGIHPTIRASQLRAVVLNCGAYDLGLPDYNGPFGSFLHTVLWAYSGKKNFLADPTLKQASVVNYVTKDFPPAFITAGNVDPLETQSTEFAKKLSSLGVQTDTLFYPQDHQPQLNHEYQFDLDTDDGRGALARIVAFLRAHTQ